MNLKQLASGVVCTGFSGTHLDARLERELSALSPAGVVLFARNVENVEQLRRLTTGLREILDRPVIAIDQEGGRVMRLREGVAQTPSMRDLAAGRDPGEVQRAATRLAEGLNRAGVNLNFAPVLDLDFLPGNSVIGDRSFGADPQLVAQLGRAYARGLEMAGICATFKHFPGHGSTEVDSHTGLPVVDADEQTLRTRDFVPFGELLPGARAVMTAHIIFRALDAERPATLSRRILTDLLRAEMGFRGACFTDCMEMDAVAKNVGSVRGAVEALKAGADCVLISHRPELAAEIADAIVAATRSGDLLRSRLEQAYERVQLLRVSLC